LVKALKIGDEKILKLKKPGRKQSKVKSIKQMMKKSR
jgi:hypothetical protein